MLSQCPAHRSSVNDQHDLEALLNLYHQRLRHKGQNETTIRHRRKEIMIFTRWAAKQSVTRCDQIDTVTLTDFRDFIAKTTDCAGYRWNPKMQRRTLNCVGTWLGWMLQDEWLPDAATDALKALR